MTLDSSLSTRRSQISSFGKQIMKIFHFMSHQSSAIYFRERARRAFPWKRNLIDSLTAAAWMPFFIQRKRTAGERRSECFPSSALRRIIYDESLNRRCCAASQNEIRTNCVRAEWKEKARRLIERSNISFSFKFRIQFDESLSLQFFAVIWDDLISNCPSHSNNLRTNSPVMLEEKSKERSENWVRDRTLLVQSPLSSKRLDDRLRLCS